ncbi:hypothetical protein Tco_1077399, partial [Tanacetum coccineum]
YAELLWEGLHYALKIPSTQIPYPRFTKIIIGHYMTVFLKISRRDRDNTIIWKTMRWVDVSTTQSQPIESTQRTHRTINAPRSPNPDMDEAELIPTIAEADDIILQDTIQVSLTEQKSYDELEAKQNVQKVKEHLIAKEIEKLVEGTEK